MKENNKTGIDKDFRFKEKKYVLGIIPKFWGEKEKIIEPEELKRNSPIMLYIDETNNIKIHKNVNVGYITPKDKDGREKGYRNKIESRKLLNLEYGDEKIPVYIQYEKEYYSYPIEPILDAESISTSIDLLQASYEKFKEDMEKSKIRRSDVYTWLWLIGGIIGIIMATIYGGMILGVWDYLFSNGGAEQVVETVVENTTENATENDGTVIF